MISTSTAACRSEPIRSPCPSCSYTGAVLRALFWLPLLPTTMPVHLTESYFCLPFPTPCYPPTTCILGRRSEKKGTDLPGQLLPRLPRKFKKHSTVMSWFTFPPFHLTVKGSREGGKLQQRANAKAEKKTYFTWSFSPSSLGNIKTKPGGSDWQKLLFPYLYNLPVCFYMPNRKGSTEKKPSSANNFTIIRNGIHQPI